MAHTFNLKRDCAVIKLYLILAQSVSTEDSLVLFLGKTNLLVVIFFSDQLRGPRSASQWPEIQ